MWCVADWVLRALDAELGGHPPERGGALLGPPGRPLVTRFEPDPGAHASASRWAPSAGLGERVTALERGEGLELKGLVHSHPGALDQPSAQDARELAAGLAHNPHLACYLGPIVSLEPPAGLGAHEVALARGKLSLFAARRSRGGGAEVAPEPLRAIPLLRDLERAAQALGGGRAEPFVTDAGEGPLLAGRLRLDGGGELLVLAGEHYPALPPVALAAGEREASGQLALSWPLALAEDERLAAALAAVLEGRGPRRRAYGPPGGPALTRDPGRARLAGWTARLADGGPEAREAARRGGLRARSAARLPEALRERAVLVAGCGSVGSYLAELLARAGVGRLALLDPEVVEPANLSRTVFAAEDVGRSKPEALARRLLAVEPSIALALEPRAVDGLPPAALDARVREADLVLAATDDPAAQRALDRFAYARGRPALFVGLYAGAQGGEVILTVPGRTACYLCATRSRHGLERAGGRVARELDYGTGRLRGEVALAADVQHVASAAAKLALALLAPEGDAGPGPFAEQVIASGATYLTLSTVPGYWFYPQVFGDTPGQGAYQSVWLTPARAPDCPVCGPPEARCDPLEVPRRTPDAAAIARALRDAGA
ncbi:UBA/THIF-type NAD/FAD binding protein [Anaeromyxobacter dehalogenans 2CP-1]|uniref:UBA/THIF-type NAD/FAD binding protein n=1 Tax=Anaeromyxobacter dehalogenans (strain ATCC BAA-258 / DSM 21875 / 2CP-1) TaxID=455488 RepID=B8JG53_ANAD2|nr:UBA/THIF-type NAD/FAD binding protein [Anaeromyxobacter dehalogenans 2CP-1]